MAYQSRYTGKEVEHILDEALLREKQTLTENEKKQVKLNLGIKEPDLTNYATKNDVEDAISKIPTLDVGGQISAALVDYVKKVEGKGLSTNDFTNELKEKLEGITPYDPSALEAEIGKLEASINTLVSGNASNAIESFNEIIAFLKNVSDTESLSSIIAGINTRIAEVEAKIPTKVSDLENDKNYLTEHQDISHLATKDELQSKQDIISDLANIREGAAKGSTAIQEEQYKGTIAAVDTDESVDDPNIPSGSYDDTEIKEQIAGLASEVERKQENLISGQNIKTINGTSLLGEGDIKIEGGDSYDDTELKNQITDLETEVSKKADEAETASKLSELGSKVGEISKYISPTITNLQIDGLLDSLDKIKMTYHDPILSLYDGGVKVSPTLDSSKPYPNIYLTDIGTFDKDETYLVLSDIYNVGGGMLQFYLENDRYSAVILDKKRLVKTDIVTVPANKRTRFRIQSGYEENGYYIIYAVMVFKVPENIPSDEFQRNILNYYNTVGYKQSYGGVMDSEHSNSASVADRLKVKDIELWGDSLTEQNYGEYISGANVSVNGFGGKTSTYIRDKFLSDADKKATQVIWVGRNNYHETDVIIDDIRDMVSTIEHNDFIIMCPPNGGYGTFGANGSDGTGEMKGGNAHSKFLELEKRLSEEYPSNFLNIRKAVIEGWRMGNVKLMSNFTQPSVGENVTIEVSDANFLTTYNSYDENKFGHEFVAKIRIGVNGSYDVYKIVEKVGDTHLTVQLEEINRISSGNTVENIVDSGGTNSVKYLRVMQNADYMCWLYDTTLSTFRKDSIHMTEDGLKLVAQIVSRKLASMKLL